MNLKIWKARKLIKRIERNRQFKARCIRFIKKANEWIKYDNTQFRELCKSMTHEEICLLALKIGVYDIENYQDLMKTIKR